MADTDPLLREAADRGPAAFHVGDWLVEPAWNRISREAEAHSLEPRVMRLLLALAASPGHPLTRAHLLDAVWPEVQVNEEALSRAISLLRRALCDDRTNPRYIATVHKRGYSLIADVEPGETRTVEATGSVRGRWRLAAACLGVLLALTAYAAMTGKSALSPPAAALVPRPLTSEIGREIDPAISRDGNRFAYGASTEEGYDLFWRPVAGGPSIRLTHDGRFAGFPTWSPRGDKIAFLTGDGDRMSVATISLPDGELRRIVQLRSWSAGLDWSPDGRTIVYTDDTPDGRRAVTIIDLATRARRIVHLATSPLGVSRPSFAPDGRRLAFLRDAGLGLSRIFVLDLADPEQVRPATARPSEIAGFDWNAQGSSLIYAARAALGFRLWEVPASGGAERLIPTEGGDLFNPSVAADGRIVAEAVSRDSDVWRAGLQGGSTTPLLRSTSDDHGAALSPDGGRVAFISSRSGTAEIWIAGANGENESQLTRLGGHRLGSLVWSPDGRDLAFYANRGGYAAAHILTLAGRRLRSFGRLEDAHQIPLGWSQASEEFLTAAGSGSHWTIWRHHLRAGRTEQLNAMPARLVTLAGDGRSIWLVTDDAMLLGISLGSNRVLEFPLPPSLTLASGIQALAEAVYLFVPNRDGTSIYRWSFRVDDRFRSLGTVPSYAPLSISPDGNSVLFTREREAANDIVMLRP